MNVPVATYLTLLALGLAFKVLRDHQLGRCELFTVRNAALAGFIVFQLTSGALALFTGNHGYYYVRDPGVTPYIFAAMATVFLVITLWSYRRGWGAIKLAHRLPATWATPGDSVLLATAVLVTLLALVLRLGVRIPLVSILTSYFGIGLASLGCGLVGWVWARQLMNPLLIATAAVVFMANAAIVVTGEFGRRGLVAVGAALMWGMYYSQWRYLPVTGIASRMATISIVPLIVLSLYSSVRSAGEHHRTAGEHLREIQSHGSIGHGLSLMLGGQGAASISMWIIENYPNNFPYRHLLSLRHFLVYPVPRMIWPDKPLPITQDLPRQISIPGASRDLNLGPGIVGHAEAEGGWYALVIYAIAIGVFLRFFDELIVANMRSPLVTLSVGCGLGEVIGMSRGSVSGFAFIYLLTVVGALGTMIVIGKLLEYTSWGGAGDGGDDQDEYEDDWDDYGDPDGGSIREAG